MDVRYRLSTSKRTPPFEPQRKIPIIRDKLLTFVNVSGFEELIIRKPNA